MKLAHCHVVVTLLSVFFQAAIFHLPKLTHGNEISDGTKYNLIENNQAVQDRLDLPQLRVPSRSLESDNTCAKACDAESMSTFQKSFQSESLIQETEDEDTSRGFFSRVTGLFDDNRSIFSRLMNGIFKIFNRSEEEDPKYMISTKNMIPFLSTYSTKIKSLAALIHQESPSHAALSTTPEFSQMMYSISAKNMEAVAAVIDPILEDMQQNETIDIRTVSCNMMQMLTQLRDVTVPHIELITKLIYTTSNNVEIRDIFNEYTGTGSTENTEVSMSMSLPTASSREQGICLDASSKATSAGLFDDGLIPGLLTLLFGAPCLGCNPELAVDVGPIGNIVAIVILIVLFPLSIVTGITVGSILIILILFRSLFPKAPDETEGNDDWYAGYVLAIAVLALIGAPVLVALAIWQNINELFQDLLEPFLPDAPSPPTVQSYNPVFAPLYYPPPPYVQSYIPMYAPLYLSVNPPVNPPASVPNAAQQRSDITYRLVSVLESPIDTIVNAVRNANRFLDARTEDEEEIDCEMAALQCRNDALMDILPF